MTRTSATALHYEARDRHRLARRYDIALRLQYATMRRGDKSISGSGESLNISRTGLLFRCDGRPQNGDSIVVVLDWPTESKDNESLKLVVTGVVVRVRRPFVAVSLYSHRFLSETELQSRLDVLCPRSSAAAPEHAIRAAVEDGPPTPAAPLLTWAFIGAPKQRHPLPIVMIEEDDSVFALISSAIPSAEWQVERADITAMKEMIERGEPAISFVITRTPELLENLPAHIPGILTLDETETDDAPAQISDARGRFAIRRPLTVVSLRLLVSLLRNTAVAQRAVAVASGAA